VKRRQVSRLGRFARTTEGSILREATLSPKLFLLADRFREPELPRRRRRLPQFAELIGPGLALSAIALGSPLIYAVNSFATNMGRCLRSGPLFFAST
jgi:hypothetical protein